MDCPEQQNPFFPLLNLLEGAEPTPWSLHETDEPSVVPTWLTTLKALGKVRFEKWNPQDHRLQGQPKSQSAEAWARFLHRSVVRRGEHGDWRLGYTGTSRAIVDAGDRPILVEKRKSGERSSEWEQVAEATLAEARMAGTFFHGTSEPAARQIAKDGHLRNDWEYEERPDYACHWKGWQSGGGGEFGGSGDAACWGAVYLTTSLPTAIEYAREVSSSYGDRMGLVVVHGPLEAQPDEDVIAKTLMGYGGDARSQPVKLPPKLEAELWKLTAEALAAADYDGEKIWGEFRKPTAKEARTFFDDDTFFEKVIWPEGRDNEDAEQWIPTDVDDNDIYLAVAQELAWHHSNRMSFALASALMGDNLASGGEVRVAEVWLLPRDVRPRTLADVKKLGEKIK